MDDQKIRHSVRMALAAGDLPHVLKTSWPLVLVITVFLVSVYRMSKTRSIPASIPYIRAGEKGSFSIIPARFRDAKNGTALTEEGYKKYSKNGLAFASMGMYLRPEITLPPSDMRWLIDQPDDHVAQSLDFTNTLLNKYYVSGLPDKELFYPPFVGIDLKKIGNVQVASIWQQVATFVDEICSSGTWETVDVGELSKAVVMRVLVRAFLGEKLANDSAFVADVRSFSTWFNGTIFPLFALVPDFLKPIAGPLFAYPARHYLARIDKKLMPIIHELLEAKEQGELNEGDTDNLLRCYVSTRHNSVDLDPRRIASRLLILLATGAFDTISRAFHSALTDLASGPVEGNVGKDQTHRITEHQNVIRAEVQNVLQENSGSWTRQSMHTLVHTESFLREVMRRRTFLARQLHRVVVKDCGLHLPKDSCGGAIAPKGTWLAVPGSPVHLDDDVWEDAREFKAWRFLDNSLTPPAIKPQGTVAAITDSFLSFGKGRHACPGRFFAGDVMKLAVACIASEYDIKPLASRPQDGKIMDLSLPAQVNIEIRRRNR
ncbi:hypothetical protein AA0119_g13494 [Alternaria tenuissima]|uniref:Cytochrome P450 n=2 Tax=Alternaria alternata complex TaxID=187734 RepID=A0A4V1WNC1_ALTAL|nr:hypothetical protein AA0117_g13355 [Alternaria alternata]RYN80663.1 hypothetical protein AA0119_g13494 [Alternaria tenuissima]RYN97669.1 hypothetical protein AA0121_g13513 [Alternaria tenuissima]RYO44974.1 hypothetical protein AA0116_g13494 [Alternaria tenuissima]